MIFDWSQLQDRHALLVGATRKGKSFFMSSGARFIVNSNIEGLTWIDAHGGCASLAEYMANPANGQSHRTVHILDATRSTFGLNPLEPVDDSWEAAHDAANNFASVIENQFGASPEQTPLMATIAYASGLACSKKKLTILEMLEMLSLGGHELRENVLRDFNNPVVRRVLADLHELAQKRPHEFLAQVQSTRNRLVRWLGDNGRLMRMLSQRTGFNPRTVMDGRHITLADLSSFSSSEASFIGSIITNSLFTAARRRPPLRCARHRLLIDEAENFIGINEARVTDQCSKYGLNLVIAIQRLQQLLAKGPLIADAIFTNALIKVCFGVPDPDSAIYLARLLSMPFLNLAEWKPGTERPLVTGQHREHLTNRSRADHVAESETTSVTTSSAYTKGRTTTDAYSEAETESFTEAEGTTDTESFSDTLSTATSLADTIGSSSSAFSALSDSASFDPNTTGLLFLQPTQTGVGQATSSGTGLSSIAASTRATTSGRTTTVANAHSTSHSTAHTVGRMTGYTHAIAESESETHGVAHGRSRGTSRGHSTTTGEAETLASTFQWLPSQTYSLEEQIHRIAGILMQLPRREAIVKIEEQEPFRIRTEDLAPAFKNATFKKRMLPLYLQACALRSPFTLSHAEADAAIAERVAAVNALPPEPDFTAPEQVPIVDDPAAYARHFHTREKPEKRAPKKPRPPRRPRGNLGPEHTRFAVVDGDKTDGDNGE